MNRRWLSMSICLFVLCLASTGIAKEKSGKPGPLMGTWECTLHGGPHDKLPFSLTLQHNGDIVTGSYSSPIGSGDLSTATYKAKAVELHIDADDGNWVLTGKLMKDGELSGDWTHGDSEKGTWDGKKQPAESK
jgi:hypothetical protein